MNFVHDNSVCISELSDSEPNDPDLTTSNPSKPNHLGLDPIHLPEVGKDESRKKVCTKTPDINSLVDIRSVTVDTSLPQTERIANFLEQIKNPYLFKCDKVVVQIEFANTEETLEDRLKSCFLSLSG
ncbi:MAG: hypothetical protein FWD97_08695 [Defluviitaleaceae bacterium]|nr:hypothetical protein [Defluviitaleaceae bacterium]